MQKCYACYCLQQMEMTMTTLCPEGNINMLFVDKQKTFLQSYLGWQDTDITRHCDREYDQATIAPPTDQPGMAL